MGSDMEDPNEDLQARIAEMKSAGLVHLPGYELEPEREQSVQSLYLDEHGRETPNPIPVAPPVGYIRQPTMMEQMRRMIAQASADASQMGAETEDEANDFDVGEDYEPTSPWEDEFEPNPLYDHMLALRSEPPKQQVQAQPAPVASPSLQDGSPAPAKPAPAG